MLDTANCVLVAQFIGMAQRAAVDAKMRQKFSIASEILGFDLLEICNKGPKSLLDSTEISQPAIFVTSMQCMDLLMESVPDAFTRSSTIMMGLSLGKYDSIIRDIAINFLFQCSVIGEYSALCCAGAFSFEDGVRLTRARGKAMQHASDITPSGMISVSGLSLDAINAFCQAVTTVTEGKPLWIANYLGDTLFTLCGSREACEKGRALLSSPPNGAAWSKTRATLLPVSGAFHSCFMESAISQLQSTLDTIVIKPPSITVISNVDGSPYSSTNSDNVKEKLIKQLVKPVQWAQCMKVLVARRSENAVNVFEVGPGTVCKGILKRMEFGGDVESVGLS